MTIGLILTSLGLGIRHGIDWDHIAAIADLTSGSDNRRQGFIRSLLYALGHAAVVFVLGVAVIAFGRAVPDGVDSWMGRVVGLTLVALGVFVIVQLVRQGRHFRLRSRWMLVLDGTFAGLRRVRTARARRRIEIDHSHPHDHVEDLRGHELDDGDMAVQHDHAHSAESVRAVPALVGSADRRSLRAGHRHTHRHHHELTLPDQAFVSYGGRTATGIGMLHGIGFESPTQIAVFVAATSAGGAGAGLVLLLAWVVGLVIANSGLALLAGAGLLGADRSFRIYALLAVIVGVVSIAIGLSLVAGVEALPSF